MPTLAQIRAAVKAKVAGVADIGQVHDYERYAKVQSAMQAEYIATIGATKFLRGWFIAFRSRSRRSPGQGRYEVRTMWELRGFHALDDAAASEKTFDDLCEAIELAFQADENLGGVVSSTVLDAGQGGGEAGLQITEKNAALFAGVLCHAMRARLTTVHYE